MFIFLPQASGHGVGQEEQATHCTAGPGLPVLICWILQEHAWKLKGVWGWLMMGQKVGGLGAGAGHAAGAKGTIRVGEGQ